MDNLGQYLKSLREENNIQLETVHDEIKLSIEQIEAMEKNKFTMLGNYGFAKAMVYSYIRFLNADEKLAMNLFEMMWPSQKETEFMPRKPIKERKMLISTNFIWLIGIIIIIIMLGVIILISYSRGYLKRPFDTNSDIKDSTRSDYPIQSEEIKPDSIRARMLNIAKETKQNNAPQSRTNSPENTFKPIIKPDTIDYIDEMIFQTKDSPFNSKI